MKSKFGTGLMLMALLFGSVGVGKAAIMRTDDVHISTSMIPGAQTAGVFGTRATLYKIIVSSPGTSGSTVEIYDRSSAATTNNRVTILDTTAVRDIEFNVLLSSGLTVKTSATSGEISVLYRPGVSARNPFGPFLSSSTANSGQNNQIFTGKGFLHKIIVSKSSGSNNVSLEVFDRSPSTATMRIANIDPGVFSDRVYDLFLSSGLTYNGNGADLTFIYKKF